MCRLARLLLVSLAGGVHSGQVLSSLRPAVRARASLEPANANEVDDVALLVQKLVDSSPNATLSLRAVYLYLERVQQRGASRAICMWDPAFVQLVAPSPEARACLEAAGFDRETVDARSGAPYLQQRRRVSPRVLRALTLELRRALVAMGDGDGATAAPAAPARRNATSVVAVANGGPQAEQQPRPPRAPAASPEHRLVEQISGMISGLIKELERQAPGGGAGAAAGAARNETEEALLAGEAAGGESNDTASTPSSQQPPVHFRVYRSPSFPGFPPGGGLPFLPTGGGGGEADEDGDVPSLERRLRAAGLPAEAEEAAQRELKRLRRMSPMHSEYSTLVDYLETIADLPWNKSSDARLSLAAAEGQLDADHFGMEKVKARILEFLAVCKLKGDTRGSILCMHGPPGIGKTSLGKSIATALNREFYRVSLGGVHTEAEVRGHRRTYVGAMPGLILQAIKKCGTDNCVIMLDEVDKLGRNSLNGDPASALLEVLPPLPPPASLWVLLPLPVGASTPPLRPFGCFSPSL